MPVTTRMIPKIVDMKIFSSRNKFTNTRFKNGAINTRLLILAVVEENTGPDSLIGMTGGGNLGYFISDRTIVNMDGLINSYAYFLAHKEGRADDYLAEMGMDYVFVNPLLLENIPYKGEFDGRLGEPIANFAKKAVIEFYRVEIP